MTIHEWLTTITAGDLMETELVSVSPDMTLAEAAVVLQTDCVTGAPVVDERGVCRGVLSTRDLIMRGGGTAECRGAGEAIGGPRVRDVMTQALLTVERCAPVGAAVRIMLDGAVHRLFVLNDEDRIIGVLSMSDVLAGLLRVGEMSDAAVACWLTPGE